MPRVIHNSSSAPRSWTANDCGRPFSGSGCRAITNGTSGSTSIGLRLPFSRVSRRVAEANWVQTGERTSSRGGRILEHGLIDEEAVVPAGQCNGGKRRAICAGCVPAGWDRAQELQSDVVALIRGRSVLGLRSQASGEGNFVHRVFPFRRMWFPRAVTSSRKATAKCRRQGPEAALCSRACAHPRRVIILFFFTNYGNTVCVTAEGAYNPVGQVTCTTYLRSGRPQLCARERSSTRRSAV